MSFNPDTQQLWEEIRAAMSETAQHVEACNDIVRRMTGRFYRRDQRGATPDPENFAFSYLSNMLPVLGQDNPQVGVAAARIIGHKIIAQAMEDGLNAWVRDVDYCRTQRPVHMDFLMVRGVLMHYLDEDARFSRGSVTPKVMRIDPRRFFQDALADSADTDAFRGHWYWADLDSLRMDEEILPEAKEKLAPSGEGTEAGQVAAPFAKKTGDALGRKRVKCYSVWMRERKTIRVMVEGDTATELYPERPYYGDEDGPYVLIDAYPVPDQAWPLAPLVAVNDQVVDLNIHVRAMARSAARRKSLGLVEANNADLGEKLTDAEDGEILPVKGLTGQFVQIEVGGATKEQFTTTEVLRQRLERISGLTATVAGNVQSSDTATEAKIADDALNQRVGYLKDRVVKATRASLTKVGWYLYHTEGIVIPVNRRDPYSGEAMEGLFFGGPSPTDHGATWEDFDLRIKVNTMQIEMLARENMVGFYQAFLQISQMAPRMPWVRWMNVLRDLAEVFKVPDKADEWMIPELFGAFGQPPMFPPSSVMGGADAPPMPPAGATDGPAGYLPAQGARQPHPGEAFGGGNGGGNGGGFGSPENPIGRTGRATGPRPGQNAGAAMNPLNAA